MTKTIEVKLPITLYEAIKAAGSVQERLNIAVREYLSQKYPPNGANLSSGKERTKNLLWDAPDDLIAGIRVPEGSGASIIIEALRAYCLRCGLKPPRPAEEVPVQISDCDAVDRVECTFDRDDLAAFYKLPGKPAENLISACRAYRPGPDGYHVEGRLRTSERKTLLPWLTLDICKRLPGDMLSAESWIRAAVRSYLKAKRQQEKRSRQ